MDVLLSDASLIEPHAGQGIAAFKSEDQRFRHKNSRSDRSVSAYIALLRQVLVHIPEPRAHHKEDGKRSGLAMSIINIKSGTGLQDELLGDLD